MTEREEWTPEEYAELAVAHAVHELARREGYSGLALKTHTTATELVRWSRGHCIPPAPSRDVFLRRACR